MEIEQTSEISIDPLPAVRGMNMSIGPDWKKMPTAAIIKTLEGVLPILPNRRDVVFEFMAPLTVKFAATECRHDLNDMEKLTSKSEVAFAKLWELLREWGPYMGKSGRVLLSDMLLFILERQQFTLRDLQDTEQNTMRPPQESRIEKGALDAYKSNMRDTLRIAACLEEMAALRWARDEEEREVPFILDKTMRGIWANWAHSFLVRRLFMLRARSDISAILYGETYQQLQSSDTPELQNDDFYYPLVARTWQLIKEVNVALVDAGIEVTAHV